MFLSIDCIGLQGKTDKCRWNNNDFREIKFMAEGVENRCKPVFIYSSIEDKKIPEK